MSPTVDSQENRGIVNKIKGSPIVSKLILALMVLLAVGLSVVAIIYRDWIQGLEAYGYLGVFLINLIASASLMAPGLGLVVVFTAGGLLNPFIVGAAAGLGEGIGALVSYTLGQHGKHVVFNVFNGNKIYDSIYFKIRRWMRYHGTLTLFASSAIVNPFFVPVGMAAAVCRIPRWKYFMACWGGKTVKGIIIALIGSIGLKAIFKAFGIPM
ncbi:MAG: VTT domain-containing protein [Dehalococcoidia bacterium]|nr:VTT domain-containing protein [Dehalococcoidia bacterium]